MLYTFILESIGTAELILIGLVALIIFGPRKLPEFARMLGKARNEFKRTTDEFKQTWEREVDFESIDREIKSDFRVSNTIGNSPTNEIETSLKSEIIAPEVKEIRQADFEKAFPKTGDSVSEKADKISPDKRDWL